MQQIQLAIIGDHYIPETKAKKLTEDWIDKLAKKYHIDTICTLKNDPVGKHVRKYCKKKLPDTERIMFKSHETEEDMQRAEFEVTVGRVMWAATHFLVFSTGNYGYASICEEQCKRMRIIRKLKKVQVKI